MDNSRPRRSIDDFLIHPTVFRMDESNDAAMAITPPQEIFALKPSRKTPEAAASIRDLRDEPIFWHGYTSEEELASPVDNDDDFSFSSIHSDTDSVVSIVDGSYHMPTTAQAQQLCSQAQVVQVVSAGKAKVVSMPKINDVEPFQRTIKPTTPSSPPPSNSDLLRMYYEDGENLTSTPSPRSSAEDWPISPTTFEQWPISPTTFERAERQGYIRSVRRRPNLTQLHIFPRSESPYELTSVPKAFSPPKTAKTVNFLDYDQQASPRAITPSTPLPKRKLHKLSSSFSLRTFSKGFKRSSASEKSVAGLTTSLAMPAQMPYTISEMHIPSRTSSKPLPKMVPRGASERAPPIVLPPCPYDYAEQEIEPTTPWPLRNEPVAPPSPTDFQQRFATTRDRRKSLPTYVSSQV